MKNINNKLKTIYGVVFVLIALTIWTSSLKSQVWTPQVSGTQESLNSVWFNSTQVGWSVGEMGASIFTVNGGMNWDPANISGEDLNDIEFRNLVLGITVGHNGMIFRTTNAGVMWTQIMSGINSDLNTVSFGADSIVYAAGHEGIILKSTDNGLTWMRVNSLAGAAGMDEFHINGSSAKGSAFAIFAGDGGVILATTNGGMSFTMQNSHTDRDLKGVFFFSDQTGFVGGKDNTIMFTSNGGANWIPRSSGLDMDSGEAEVNGIFFVNSMTGWAVGDHGAIFITTNGGMMWTPENSQTTEDLEDVFFFDENHGWTVGHEGTIRFRGMINAVDPHQNIVNGFLLEQNFPNPFNPSTKIIFELPVSSFVSLTVYDMTGKAIDVILNGKLSAGSHELEFDGSNLSSGVYFYILKTPAFSESKKMILIK